MSKPKTNEQILANAKSAATWGTVAGIASAASSLYGGIMGMQTAKRYGRMQQRAAEAQARLNEIATERNIGYQTRQTADRIADIKRQGKQVVGAQLAAMAASGMSTASGSSQALLRSTGYSVGRDVSTLQANLINSAYEQRRQMAIDNIGLQYSGAMAAQAGRAQGFGQLAQGVSGALSSMISVADKWARLDELTMMNRTRTPIIDNAQMNKISNQMVSGKVLDLANFTGVGKTSNLDILKRNLTQKFYIPGWEA